MELKGVVGGVTLFLLGKPKEPDTSTASVWPLIGLGSAGVGGRF